MARITPIPVAEWPEDMSAFARNGPLGEVEADLLGIHAHTPATTRSYYRTLAILKRESSLDERLFELVRLRIAFFNQCRSCMAIRHDDVLDEELVCSLERPEEAPDLTEAERAALRFAELLATDHLRIDDDVYADLRKHFSESQIVELGTYCAFSLGMGRLNATWDVIDHVPQKYTAQGQVTPW